MDMRKYGGGAFIKVDDGRLGPLDLQIAVVKTGKFDKPDVVFETGEVLSLNATNTKSLIRTYGPESDDWVGKEIRLKLGKAPYQGDLIDSVVIEPISPPTAAADKARAATVLNERARRSEAVAPADSDLDDEIPF
jgi:hypothetical protein